MGQGGSISICAELRPLRVRGFGTRCDNRRGQHVSEIRLLGRRRRISSTHTYTHTCTIQSSVTLTGGDHVIRVHYIHATTTTTTTTFYSFTSVTNCVSNFGFRARTSGDGGGLLKIHARRRRRGDRPPLLACQPGPADVRVRVSYSR